MKVLHMITELGRGGVENWLMSMVRVIPRQTCEMDFCCKTARVGNLVEEARSLGSKVLFCPLRPDHIGFLRCLENVLLEGRYDIVHNHLNAYSGLPVWTARKLGVPVITTFHTTRLLPEHPLFVLPVLRHLRAVYARFSVWYALRNSALITGVSQAALDRRVPPNSRLREKCRALYLGVEIPDLPPAGARADFRGSFGWSSDAQLVVHVGNFKELKNHRGVIEVFYEALQSMPTAKLLLVGDGLLRPKIERLAAGLGIEASVRFLGIRRDVLRILTCSNVFLFPSLEEGFGLGVLEAGASGIPVVGTPIPALTEPNQHDKTALIHHADDISGMAESVIRLLKDKDYAQRLGAAGRKRAVERFAPPAAAERLLRLYEEALDREFPAHDDYGDE